MVAGGLELISYTTRLIPFTLLMISFDTFPRKSLGIGLRVTAFEPAVALCRAFGGALVSTSANPHGQPAARTPQEVVAYFGDGPDGLLLAPVGGLEAPTCIRDALTGAIIRP